MVDVSIFVPGEDQGPGRLFEIEKISGHRIQLVRPVFHDFEFAAFPPYFEQQIIPHIVFPRVFIQFRHRHLNGFRFFEIEMPGIPVLIVQSSEDPVVDPKGSRHVFDLIGSEDKEYVLFNFNRHGILLGEGSQRVHKTIGSFLERLK